MTTRSGAIAGEDWSRRDARVIGAIALAARALVVAWAASRFPPAADGTFYNRIAERIAAGLGYTWLWPDGAVTFAAHYPVGYPAMIGGLYAVLGAHPGVAMGLNAALGALAAVAVHRLAARAGSRRAAAIAGLLVALHPGLLAYTAALMTEGVTAALLACAAWVSAAARDALEASATRKGAALTIAAGLILGVATLVRPQSIVLAPLFALLAWAGAGRGARASALATALGLVAALLVCAPWTIRNCDRMKSCALVSVNGGWNLLIGTDAESTGTWAPIKVPAACREVFDEAQKDACFGREARRYIGEHPGAWIALAPKKLAATFNYCDAAAWYLNTSNGAAFSDRSKLALGVAETGADRLLLLFALACAVRSLDRERGRRSPWTIAGAAVALVGALFLVLTNAWISYLAFVIASLLRGRALLRGPLVAGAAVAVVLATMLTHAAVFGAGRYSLPVIPLLCGAAALFFASPLALTPSSASPELSASPTSPASAGADQR